MGRRLWRPPLKFTPKLSFGKFSAGSEDSVSSAAVRALICSPISHLWAVPMGVETPSLPPSLTDHVEKAGQQAWALESSHCLLPRSIAGAHCLRRRWPCVLVCRDKLCVYNCYLGMIFNRAPFTLRSVPSLNKIDDKVLCAAESCLAAELISLSICTVFLEF